MNSSKNNLLINALMIVIIVGLFITLALDFAALHDINNEYMSKNTLKSLDIQVSKDVPIWTENKGEWDYLTLSFIVKIISYSVLFLMAIWFYKKGPCKDT